MVNVPFDDDASDGTPEEIHGSLETPQDHAREIVRCLELLQADFEMTLDEAWPLIYSLRMNFGRATRNSSLKTTFFRGRVPWRPSVAPGSSLGDFPFSCVLQGQACG